MIKNQRVQKAFGWVCVLLSALVFYLASAMIRKADGAEAPRAEDFVVARFLLGVVVAGIVIALKRKIPRPGEYRYLGIRGVSNFIAVVCFFKAVELVGSAEANILNLTYPLFISIFTFLFMRTKGDSLGYLLSLVSFVGIVLVVGPSDFSNLSGSIWGLASGMTAAVAIITLNLTRQHNDTDVVLFYMFLVGGVLSVVFFGVADLRVGFKWLLASAAFGVAGQYLLTFGFKYVSAVEGGVLSSFRILIAAFLGPVIANDLPLSLIGWIGAMMILFANILLTTFRSGLVGLGPLRGVVARARNRH